MLNGREREGLADIERRLLMEDPRYSKPPETEIQLVPTSGAGNSLGEYPILMLPSLTFESLFFMAGSAMSALAFLAVAVLTWAARHYSHMRTKAGP